jgi:putative thioredoxin
MNHELMTDFETAVVAQSHRTPVVLDFWATWCGPCKILGPILEKLAAEAKGTWTLVQVDTDRHPDLAQALGVEAIPSVFMVHRGEIVGAFSGALPEPQVRAWLQKHLPPGIAAPKEETPREPSAGDREAALRKTLAESPDDHAARVDLARLLALGAPEEAASLAAEVPEEDPAGPAARNVEHLVALLRWGRGGDGPGVSGPAEDLERYRNGAVALAQGRYGDALEAWIQGVERNRAFADDGARRACVALFEALGPGHSLTAPYRRRLSTLLF